MARYTGPRVRTLRALGTELPGLTRKKADRRPYPPGQHGQERGRKTFGKPLPAFKAQLLEKQKLRYNYGVSEKQLRNYYALAKRMTGSSADNLLALLERRFDNVIFRAGYAPTIPAARQLIVHGHVQVNGRRLDRPAYVVRAGDKITVTEKAKNNALVAGTFASPSLTRPEWLNVDADKFESTIATLPDSSSVPFPLTAQLVVEWYAR